MREDIFLLSLTQEYLYLLYSLYSFNFLYAVRRVFQFLYYFLSWFTQFPILLCILCAFLCFPVFSRISLYFHAFTVTFCIFVYSQYSLYSPLFPVFLFIPCYSLYSLYSPLFPVIPCISLYYMCPMNNLSKERNCIFQSLISFSDYKLNKISRNLGQSLLCF